MVLFGVPASTATTYEEREKEDENITCQILEEIRISKAEQEAAKIIIVIEKKKMISQNQMNFLNAVGSEQKERK